MALNWDKLTKLQRDYPKPKFAEKEVLRQLKKKPLDPYLRVWKADIILQLGDISHEVKQLLDISSRLPPVTDTRLLTYHYRICLRAARFDNPNQLPRASAGDEAIKAWQNAAKALQSKAERRALYSDLFTCAMREYCWDDVRWVAQKAGQESTRSKKKSTFVQILARQLAYEMACRVQGTRIDAKKSLDCQMAYSQTLQVFTNSLKNPTDTVQMHDMRDLRFMAQILARQNRADELIERWGDAPPALNKILTDHRSETTGIILDSFFVAQSWLQLEEICKCVVEEYNTPQACPELLRSWKLWGRYMEAVMHLHPLDNPSREKRILKIRNKELGAMSSGGREIDLTRMALSTAQAKDPSLLELCKTYWDANHHINATFHDLRRFVEVLDRKQQEEFHTYISKASSDIRPASMESDQSITTKWFRTELNVTKFDYLLTISRQDKPSEEVMFSFVTSAIKLYNIGATIREESYQDAGILAIWTLLRLHRTFATSDETEDQDQCHRFTVQASMLVLHLTAGAAGKQNRPLILLSTYLHMKMGLATIAFEQYQLARVKEILNNTISYILLSNISRIHPFDTTGTNGFSPDNELEKVDASIKRMESRVDDFLYIGLEDFQYDQAIELLEFKHKLRSSLTRHLCLIERRRIARLKCDPVDSTMYCGIEAFEEVSDDRDRNVLPGFESTTRVDPLEFLLGGDKLQSEKSMYRFLARCERYQRIIYGEPLVLAAIDDRIDAYNKPAEGEDPEPHTANEKYINDVMLVQRLISLIPQSPSLWNRLEDILKVIRCTVALLNHWVDDINVRTEYLKIAVARPEPIPYQLMPIMWATEIVYEKLEYLQLVSRLCQNTADMLAKKNLKMVPKIWKDDKDNPLKELEQEVHTVYDRFQKETMDLIKTLKKSGVEGILKQVQWGSTGQALKLVMTEEDQEYYARQYVESAVDTIEGFLKVKLK